MHEYRIFETEQCRKDLQSIARAGHEEIAGKLRRFVYPQLREHPHFGPHIRKLKGYTPETWRYRIGSWRFFYEIDDQERVVSILRHLTAARRIDLLACARRVTPVCDDGGRQGSP